MEPTGISEFEAIFYFICAGFGCFVLKKIGETVYEWTVMFFMLMYEIGMMIGEFFSMLIDAVSEIFSLIGEIVKIIIKILMIPFWLIGQFFENLTTIMWIFSAGAVVMAISAGGEAILILIPIVGILILSYHKW